MPQNVPVGLSPLAYEGVEAPNPPNVVNSLRDPGVSDINQADGTIWLNQTNSTAWMKIKTSAGLATWVSIGGTSSGSFTTVTASGNITSTGGNLVLSGAARQIQMEGGAVTDFIGTATLTSGTVTIANTNIAASDRIIPFRIAANASTTLGELSYTISAGASFTITSLILGTPASTQTADVSTVGYFIVRQL